MEIVYPYLFFSYIRVTQKKQPHQLFLHAEQSNAIQPN